MTAELDIVRDVAAENSYTVETYKGSVLKVDWCGEECFFAEKTQTCKIYGSREIDNKPN